MSNSETTEQKQTAHLFKPGQSGNPKGRPKGSRNKLGEKCIEDLYADWQEHGAAAIRKMREDRPHEYVKAVVSILPKEVKIERLDDMSDDDITNRIRQLAADLGVALSIAEGISDPAGGAEAPARPH